MARGVLFKLILTALLATVIASTAFSARKAPNRLLYNPVIRQIVNYALDGGLDDRVSNTPSSKSETSSGASLGSSPTEHQPRAGSDRVRPG